MFCGLSVFHFNPKADLNGDTYELQPLHTEGQVDGYHRVALAFPFGGGVKLSIKTVNIGLEVGVRKAYTDYIDDVSSTYPDLKKLLVTDGPTAVALSDRSLNPAFETSTNRQRGNPKNNDYYIFSGFWITFSVFNPGKASCNAYPHFRY